MDLEASLRTWAAENTDARAGTDAGARPMRRRMIRDRFSGQRILLMAASIVMVLLAGWWIFKGIPDPRPGDGPGIADQLGTMLEQHACIWNDASAVASGGRFAARTLSLASGTARLKFDSGVDLVMQGPCDVNVTSADSAELLVGKVVVHVTELSDGFVLRTPDATILDEGTEYGVSLDEAATEVHVFDGSVLWRPIAGADDSSFERIESGQARRYTRSHPTRGKHIPMRMRMFVRTIEADVRDNAGEALLAYDGFENLAGRLRRGRSGFGWSEGWKAGAHGRGSAGTIIDAPDDVVFGIARRSRQLIRLEDGDAIRRPLEKAVPLNAGDAYYISIIVRRHSEGEGAGRYVQLSLHAGNNRPRRRLANELAFGISSDGFPFVKCGNRIVQSAPAVEDDADYLLVAKVVVVGSNRAQVYLRTYKADQPVDQGEPTAWTTVGHPGPCEGEITRIRMAVGPGARADIDELRFGTTWRSVTTAPK